jgi:hypothetical protein
VSKVFAGILIGLALGAAGVVILLQYPGLQDLLKHPQTQGEPGAEEPAEESFLQQDAQGKTIVRLDPDTQTRMGLKVASLAAAEAPAEVKGWGRVLDPAPLAALLTEAASARVALQASTREFERLKVLYSQDHNASARALEAAEATLTRDRIQLESAQARLLLGWGKAVAAREDLAELVHSLVAQEQALVRVDLPLGESPKTAPAGGRLAPVAAPDHPIPAQILGPAPAADAQLQTDGFLLLARTDGLVPGTVLAAWLTLAGPQRSGVLVPRNAVLRHEGETFVYRQTGADTFQRRAVTLEHPSGTGWFVAAGLQPQENVVVVGAQQLLSEELKGQGGEE